MVLYTPASRVRYGQAGMEAKILQSVAEANTAMQNSQIQAQFSLVHMGEVAYTESGSMSVTLTALQRTTDGVNAPRIRPCSGPSCPMPVVRPSG